MIIAFNVFKSIANISQGIMVTGLMVSFLTTVFGYDTFILPRIGIIILKEMQKVNSSITVLNEPINQIILNFFSFI